MCFTLRPCARSYDGDMATTKAARSEARLATLIADRLTELMIGTAEIRHAGLDPATVRAFASGEKTPQRIDVQRRLARLLGWKDDAIRGILAGREPVTLDDAEVAGTAEQLTRRVAELESQLAELQAAFAEVQRRRAR